MSRERDLRELYLASPQVFSSGRAQMSRFNDVESAERNNQRRQRNIDPQPSNLRVEPVAPPPSPPPPPPPTYTCPICLGPMVQETSTNCGHLFCEGCIKSAMSAQGKFLCPICRRRITPRGLQRIYLPDPL